MNKTVLIFGISGFVGHYLAEEFYTNGYKIYGSDIFKLKDIPCYINFMKSDIMDAQQIDKIIKHVQPTYIVNLAAVSSVGQSWKFPQRTIEINTIGTLNILEAMRKYSSDSGLLLVGSSEEYASSDSPINEKCIIKAENPYGISKIMQEKFGEIYYKRYGIKVFYIRAFNHTGIGQKDSFVIPSWCKQVASITKGNKESNIMAVGNLHVKRDFSDVRDIVYAYRLVLEKGKCNYIYNVGSGELHELKEILDYILSLSDIKIEIKTDDSLIRSNESEYIWCDNSFIKKELGWNNKYSIFDTIRSIYESYLNELS